VRLEHARRMNGRVFHTKTFATCAGSQRSQRTICSTQIWAMRALVTCSVGRLQGGGEFVANLF
jgi:hypothetical protein